MASRGLWSRVHRLQEQIESITREKVLCSEDIIKEPEKHMSVIFQMMCDGDIVLEFDTEDQGQRSVEELIKD